MSHSPHFHVGILSNRDAAELFELRLTCYRASRDFEWLDDSTLDWTDTDETALVFGIRDANGTLISTSRFAAATSHDEAEDHFHYSMSGVPARYPALLGTRACTAAPFVRHGMTNLVRHVTLQNVIRLRLSAILAIVYDGAPRVRSMLEAGYECYPVTHHWDREARLLSAPLALSLPSDAFGRAQQWVVANAGDMLENTSFDLPAIEAGFDSLTRAKAIA